MDCPRCSGTLLCGAVLRDTRSARQTFGAGKRRTVDAVAPPARWRNQLSRYSRATPAYEACEYALASGDLIVFVTDGIVEAQNSARELFGFERLESLLAALDDPTPERVCDAVLAAVAAFTGPTPPHDDMTIVALGIA